MRQQELHSKLLDKKPAYEAAGSVVHASSENNCAEQMHGSHGRTGE